MDEDFAFEMYMAYNEWANDELVWGDDMGNWDNDNSQNDNYEDIDIPF